MEEDGVVVFVVDEFLSFDGFLLLEGCPIYWFGLLNGLHDVGDADALLPDHDGALAGLLEAFVEDAEGFVLEDALEVFVAEEDEGPHVVVGVFVDGLEDGGVSEGDDVFGLDFGQHLVAFDLFIFVEAEAVEAPEVGVD